MTLAGRPRSNSRPDTSIPRMLVALVCVLLILFVGAAQVLHMHTPDEPINPGCSLCAVAHVSVLVAPEPVPAIRVETVAAVADPEPISASQRFVSFDLYVRPPPVLTTRS